MLRSFLLYLSERETPKKILMHILHWAGGWLGASLPARKLKTPSARCDALTAEGFDVTLDSPRRERAREHATRKKPARSTSISGPAWPRRIHSHISIKLTQLGLAIDEASALRHLSLSSSVRRATATFVRIDMEGSAHTDATLRVFPRRECPRDVLGIVIQSYL